MNDSVGVERKRDVDAATSENLSVGLTIRSTFLLPCLRYFALGLQPKLLLAALGTRIAPKARRRGASPSSSMLFVFDAMTPGLSESLCARCRNGPEDWMRRRDVLSGLATYVAIPSASGWRQAQVRKIAVLIGAANDAEGRERLAG